MTPPSGGREWEDADPDEEASLEPGGPAMRARRRIAKKIEWEDADPADETPVEDSAPVMLPRKSTRRPRRTSHPHVVRLIIVSATLTLIAFMTVAGVVGWFRGHDLQAYLVIYTPVFTLAGTALGFYFSDKQRR